VATSQAELERLRELARELVRQLDALIQVERGEQQRANRVGEPLPRTRIR
jgi:hypothetical protein